MRRWFLHGMAVCGGAIAVYAAGAVQQFAAHEAARTYTISWSYDVFWHVLWALAGFCLLAPVVWTEQGNQSRRRIPGGLLGGYLVTGLVLAGALPLATVAGKMGVPSINSALIWAVTYNLDIFGAILVGVAVALALRTQSEATK